MLRNIPHPRKNRKIKILKEDPRLSYTRKYIYIYVYVRFKSSRRIIFFPSSHPSISPLCIFVYSAPFLPASRLWSLSLEEQPPFLLPLPLPRVHDPWYTKSQADAKRLERRGEKPCAGVHQPWMIELVACWTRGLLNPWPTCVRASRCVDATMHWVIRYFLPFLKY